MDTENVIREKIAQLQETLAEFEGPWRVYVDTYVALRSDPTKRNSEKAQMLFNRIMESQFQIRTITDKINNLERLLFTKEEMLNNTLNQFNIGDSNPTR